MGLASFIIIYLLIISGFKLFFDKKNNTLIVKWSWGILHTIWLTIATGYFIPSEPLYSGIIGYEINKFLIDYIGRIGILSGLVFFFLCFIVFQLGWTPEKMKVWIISFFKKNELNQNIENNESSISFEVKNNQTEKSSKEELNDNEEKQDKSSENLNVNKDEIEIEIETTNNEVTLDKKTADLLIKKKGFFDPTLELSNFKMPKIDLLKDYGESSITINQEELEVNKNKIVDTLSNYKIGIANIKATIGPTVTLYEIVPEAGIRISKIKNLEDDIALSLSALGIRIIAPIPGKGTIGIEVPNRKPSIVSMRSVISSSKFQNAEMELPVAIGKTISNETFVVDLAKMPHLLMAGATGQGKSVGLNAVLTSLLYKKHPAEIKFVLVDPKKSRVKYI